MGPTKSVRIIEVALYRKQHWYRVGSGQNLYFDISGQYTYLDEYIYIPENIEPLTYKLVGYTISLGNHFYMQIQLDRVFVGRNSISSHLLVFVTYWYKAMPHEPLMAQVAQPEQYHP